MKKILLTVFAAAMVAASCTKEPAMKESPAAERVTLGICAPVEKMTKVAELEGERTVNRIQAFVFKENGDIDAWNVSETDEVTVECSAGQREIVVVANAPDIEGVFSLSDLESRVSLLEDNSLGSLVMAGRTSMELTASSTVVVPVFRRVARISIERIVTEFKMEQFKETKDLLRIHTVIYVERDSQKGIIIGKQGVALKKVATEARRSLERFFGKSVYLEIFVKVDKNWRNSDRELRNFGYQLDGK